jgi:hypothetical protein
VPQPQQLTILTQLQDTNGIPSMRMLWHSCRLCSHRSQNQHAQLNPRQTPYPKARLLLQYYQIVELAKSRGNGHPCAATHGHIVTVDALLAYCPVHVLAPAPAWRLSLEGADAEAAVCINPGGHKLWRFPPAGTTDVEAAAAAAEVVSGH